MLIDDHCMIKPEASLLTLVMLIVFFCLFAASAGMLFKFCLSYILRSTNYCSVRLQGGLIKSVPLHSFAYSTEIQMLTG